MIELSIILVNWNCLAFTEQCLASIYATNHELACEVIVVDNDSADAPCKSLLENFPSIKLVLSEKNIGFGLANNLGVRHSKGDTLLFLNPDTIVLPQALRRMLDALHSMPDGGALGCKLLNPDGSLQKTCVQPFPTILNQLLALHWLQRLWPSLPLWGRQALYSATPGAVHEVDVVSGAAIMVRRDVFEKVGGFHSDYFMFAEEVDLCLSIQRAGYKIGHTGDAQIIHFGGQSTKSCEDGFAAVTMSDSVYRFLRRHRGRSYAATYRFALLLSAVSRISLLACIFPLTALPNSSSLRQKTAIALRKWKKIARWSVGMHAGFEDIGGASAASAAPAEN